MTRGEIEALCAIAEHHDKAATRGTWRSTWDDPPHEAYGESVAVATDAFGAESVDSIIVGTMWDSTGADGLTVACRRGDALFIAAAREGWPALAKAARELLAENERLSRRVPNIDEWFGPEEPGVG